MMNINIETIAAIWGVCILLSFGWFYILTKISGDSDKATKHIEY